MCNVAGAECPEGGICVIYMLFMCVYMFVCVGRACVCLCTCGFVFMWWRPEVVLKYLPSSFYPLFF